MELIDTPSPFASLEEWVAYRKMLNDVNVHLANIDDLKREADEQIANLRRELQ